MKKDIHYTSRLLKYAGGLMLIAGVLTAVSAKLTYGVILAAAAFCMFFASYNFRMAEDKNAADNDNDNENEKIDNKIDNKDL